tara:strand:+ start:1137 stop:1370 length:234 start_codon:yes stop_codon:yes gene_type:complete
MKKLLMILVLGLFLQGCEDASVNKAKYFKNCVKDAMKVKKIPEKRGVEFCQVYISNFNSIETFNYYKGKVYSKPKQQ